MKTVCFDICGTLYKSNTTNDFIYYLSKKNIFDRVVFFNRYVLIANYILDKISNKNFLRKLYFKKLEGMHKDFLHIQANKFS